MTTLYLATSDGLVVLSRRGESWGAMRPLEVESASCIAVDPFRPERVFCGTWTEGAWRSDNAAKDWRRVFEGLPHERITSLTVSGAERVGGVGVVYIGTEPSAVFRSEDGGQTWRECAGLTDLPSSSEWRFPPRPQTHHVRWITPDPHAAGRLFVAIEAGALVRTPDGGQTWKDRVPGGPYDTHQLTAHPDIPGRLWSAAGDGFYESDDAGDTWRKSEQALRFRYCWSVALDPADPTTAVLTAAPGARQAHTVEHAESAVFHRTGEGPWREIREGLPEPKGMRAPVVAANPVEPGVFYAAVDMNCLYHSSDAGAAWRQLNVDWPGEKDDTRVHTLAVVDVG